MITFFTGLPGHGKTLRALAEAEAERVKTGRPVYYHGIKDLKLPWRQLSAPQAWPDEAPDGALIVIDECQDAFPTRGPSQRAPEHVSKLATHRHRGLDIFLITQHPRMVDPYVRSLTGRHMHVVRKWGTHAATVHEWAAVNDQPHRTRKDSIRHDWKYPRAVYNWYTSATEHTVKRSIPIRVYIFWALPVVLLGLIGWAGWIMSEPFRERDVFAERGSAEWAGERGDLSGSAPPAVAAGGMPRPAPSGGAAAGPTVLTPAAYIERYIPRVPGLPHTAPVYDGVTQVVHAPYPAACVSMADVCRCYSQQGTRLDVPKPLCLSIVTGGYFVEWQQPPTLDNHHRAQALADRSSAGVEVGQAISLGGDPRAHLALRDQR